MKIFGKLETYLKRIKLYLKDSDYIDWLILRWRLRLNNNTWFIICPYGIGDTYLVCALAKQFLNHNGGNKIVLAVKKNHAFLIDFFPEDIQRFVVFDKFDLRLIQRFSEFKLGYPFIGHPYFLEPNLRDILGTENMNLLNVYKKIFNISCDFPITQPIVNRLTIEKAKSRFLRLKLPKGKTVILAPAANSLPTLCLEFWSLLSQELKLQGWTVCTNCEYEATDYIVGTIPIYFPLAESIPIAEMAGWVISSRSGFCDLISSAKCRLSIIYVKQQWYAGSAFEGSSLRLMGLSNKVLEYEIDANEDINLTVEKIINC